LTAILAVVRWFHEIALMLLFGGAALSSVARISLSWRGWRLAAGLAALFGGLFWFVLTAIQMGGDLQDQTLWLALTQSLFGQIFQARLALLLLLCLGLLARWRESLLALLSGTALFLISVTSHAAAASPAHFTAIGAISDGLHFLTGGFWIGGLPVLGLLYARRSEDFPRVIALFAEWGMVAVAILVLTGMLNAATILLGGEGHDAPLYLSVLGAKLALVAVMVGLALFNHFRLMPKLTKPGEAERLALNIRTEFCLGLVVVGLAVVLSLLPPTSN
jgi:putative copper resistance protein D